VRVAETASSADGTIKLLIAVEGGAVETVMIPSTARSTICVSSQIGCTRSCKFCATATLGFGRNLSADEIVAQYLIARMLAPAHAPAKNVVFMGMGEPMDNLDEVLVAVEVLTQSPAPQLGHAQVTVSTSGVLPGMRRFLAESRGSLALSLNGSTDEQRLTLMPQTKTWPIGALLDLLRGDRAVHPRRIHFVEYVLFDGVNDSDDDARRVVDLLVGINARVNLIPHNPIATSPLQAATTERIAAFHQILSSAGIRCMIRSPRGQDIAAACGQLAHVRTR
jgi:23S rRNA (adenine2503-C2)-methyltransferase